MATERLFGTFFLGNQYFGVDVAWIQEVLLNQPMTRVPLASGVIGGLVNLRGQIVTAIDLRALLGLEALEEDREPMNVVIRSEGSTVSFLVDDIGDVLDVADLPFEKPPETLQGIAKELIQGVYKLQDRLLLVVDVEELLERATARNGSADLGMIREQL